MKDALTIFDAACAEDLWFWITGGRCIAPPGDPARNAIRPCVWTQDEHARAGEEVKPFPEKEYIRTLFRLMVENPLTAIWKSRQVMATWISVARFLHQAMFRPAQEIVFQCKHEDESDARLIGKAWFIYEHLPPDLRALHPAKRTYCKIEFFEPVRNKFGNISPDKFGPATGSKILGVPEGPQHTRSHTLSGFLFDEAAYTAYVEETLRAVKPALMGAAEPLPMVIISTPNGKDAFYRLVFDIEGETSDEMSGDASWTELKAHPGCPNPGMRWRKNSNGFLAVDLDVTADPDKDPCNEWGKLWMLKAKAMYKGDPGGWAREMGRSASTTSGKPIYIGSWSNANIVPCSYIEGRPVWIGIDFGFHWPTCCWLQEASDDQLQVQHEYIGHEITTFQLADKIAELNRRWYPGCEEFRYWGDPAGRQVNSKSNRSDFQILHSKGMSITGTKIAPKVRRETIRTLLCLREDGVHGLVVDPSCRRLIDGFEGQYHYPQGDPRIPENVPDEPQEVHPYIDIHDSMQYVICCGMRAAWGASKTVKKKQTRKANYKRTGG